MRMKAVLAVALSFLVSVLATAAAAQTPPGTSGQGASPSPESVKGTLCFLSAGKLVNCAGTSELALPAEPAETARPFVWTSDDGSRVAAGTLAAKGDTIDLAAKEWRNAALRVAGDTAHGWPQDAAFRLTTPERKEWSWSLPARTIKRLTTLTLPPGRYALTVSAEHHRAAVRQFAVGETEARVSIGDITLAPLVVVNALVVTHREDREVPLGGATVTASLFAGPGPGDVKLLMTTGDDGRVHAELPPARGEVVLLIAHPGLVTKAIAVSVEPGDKDYGRVLLLPGTQLKVHLVRPDLEERKLTVDLRRQDEKYEKTELGTRTLGPHEDDLVFDDLAPAEHFVVVNGTQPLEHISKQVTIEEGKPGTLEIEIKPFTLDGLVRYGGEPLTDGKVGLSAPAIWRAEVPLDGAGRFGGTMWQRGKFSAYVSNQALFGTPFFTDSHPHGDADPTAWTIDVPKRLISGRVLDEATKEPLPKARMMVRAVFNPSWLTFDGNVQIADDGTYRVLTLKPGDWSLLVTAQGYLPANPHFQVTDTDGSRNYDVLLSQGSSQALELTWPDGAPVAGADVMEGSLGRGLFQQMQRSNPSGHVAMRGRPGDTQTVYVSPREGSLAIIHVTYGREDGKPLHMTVPLPAGTLRVLAVDESGAPALTTCLLRWNGEVLLPDALMHHGSDRSLAKGEHLYVRMPAGVYEVWPIEYGQNVPPALQPARADLASGEASATVVVPPKAH